MMTKDWAYRRVPVNVSPLERVVTAISGSMMIVDAIKHPRQFRKSELLTGAYLLMRGIYGYCGIYHLLGKKKLPDMARNINFSHEIFINRPRMEVYEYWRRFQNLPVILRHIQSVEPISQQLSQWTIQGPAGLGEISWTAETVKDEPGYLIGWTSVPGSGVETSGKIGFQDGVDGGTLLQVNLSYRPAAGVVGAAAAKLLTPAFERAIQEDMARLKYALENHTIKNYDA